MNSVRLTMASGVVEMLFPIEYATPEPSVLVVRAYPAGCMYPEPVAFGYWDNRWIRMQWQPEFSIFNETND